jgi:hypothetical protein
MISSLKSGPVQAEKPSAAKGETAKRGVLAVCRVDKGSFKDRSAT